MSPVAVSADRRFRRARVKPSRRRGRWRQVVVAAAKTLIPLAVVLVVGFRVAGMIAVSPHLLIDTISVEGNQRMSRAEIVSTLKGLAGANILTANLDEWRVHLEQTPWIREAKFRRSFPSTIHVMVTEREPMGVARVKDRLYLIDEHGAVIDNYGPEYVAFDLPIIDGLTSVANGTRAVDEPRAELAARVIRALRGKPALGRRLSQIDVSDAHNAAVIVTGDPAVIYVGDDRFLPRLESYFGLASALRERVPDIDYVDLRFDDRIYVRPSAAARGRKAVAHIASGTQTAAVPTASRVQP
ncbi:MAG: FtsQ-type POTRA domain-containing protein [Acidobacteriaceae bacterium]|jgi:cell division protein FtsQ|nr:FtsQ-type POTRA domain-containing protein [Acidobacteriaceae bacterium]